MYRSNIGSLQAPRDLFVLPIGRSRELPVTALPVTTGSTKSLEPKLEALVTGPKKHQTRIAAASCLRR